MFLELSRLLTSTMQDRCEFSAAFRLVSGNEAARQESDETSVLKTSETVTPGHNQYLDQGNEADQTIDYDPLRLIKLPLATLVPPKRFFRTFWRTAARRILEKVHTCALAR